MQIDTAGTYTLKYTAEDECGNVTEVTREVEAVQITYSTVLFTDGTFIINEKSTDRDANVALHGAVTNEYAPLSATNPYIFTTPTQRPWHGQASKIKHAKQGSDIQPTSTAYWFHLCTSLVSIGDINTSEVTNMESMFANCTGITSLSLGDTFDTSNVTNMKGMFNSSSAIRSLDLGNKFDTSKVTDMSYMFGTCRYLQSLNLGDKFDTSNVTNMSYMFAECKATESLDWGDKFDTSNVTNMEGMFSQCEHLTLELGDGFDTSKVTNMRRMFYNNYNVTTIKVPTTFVVDQVTESTDMFSACIDIVGGAGTRYNSSYKDKTYAHIDGGTSNPGYFTLKSA